MSAEETRPIKLSERSAQRDCSYCREALDERSWSCPLCRSGMHRDCAAEVGRCPSLGCSGGAMIAVEGARPASDTGAPWRIREPGLAGLTIDNSREASRLSFAVDRVGAPGEVVWRAGLPVKIPLALAFTVFGILLGFADSYVAGLLMIFLAVKVFSTPEQQGGRPRVLTVIAGPEAWQVNESYLDGSGSVSFRVAKDKGRILDDRDLAQNLVRIGENSFRLPKRPVIHQRRLFDELQRAWRAGA